MRVVLRAGVLAALLAALYGLVATGATTLTAWTERFVPVSRYPALFGGLFATWLLARLARSPRSRRAALLAGSLATAAVFDPWFLAISVAWVAGLHRVLFGAGGPRVRSAVAYCIVSYAAPPIRCGRELWPELLERHRELGVWGYAFAVSYPFRIAWLIHEARVQRTAHLPFVDVALYFVFAPFFVIVPYMLAIPRCDRFRAGLDRHDPEI